MVKNESAAVITDAQFPLINASVRSFSAGTKSDAVGKIASTIALR